MKQYFGVGILEESGNNSDLSVNMRMMLHGLQNKVDEIVRSCEESDIEQALAYLLELVKREYGFAFSGYDPNIAVTLESGIKRYEFVLNEKVR